MLDFDRERLWQRDVDSGYYLAVLMSIAHASIVFMSLVNIEYSSVIYRFTSVKYMLECITFGDIVSPSKLQLNKNNDLCAQTRSTIYESHTLTRETAIIPRSVSQYIYMSSIRMAVKLYHVFCGTVFSHKSVIGFSHSNIDSVHYTTNFIL